MAELSKKELEKLQKKVKAEKEKLSRVSNAINQSKLDIENLEKETIDAVEKKEQAKQDLAFVTNAVDEKKKELEILGKTGEEVAESIKKRNEKLNGKTKKIQESVSEYEEKIAEAHKWMSIVFWELDQAIKSKEDKEAEIKSLQVKQEKEQVKLKNTKEEQKKVSELLKKQKEGLKMHEENKEKLMKEVDWLTVHIEAKKNEIDNLVGKKNEVQGAVDVLAKEKLSLLEEIESLKWEIEKNTKLNEWLVAKRISNQDFHQQLKSKEAFIRNKYKQAGLSYE